MSFILDALRKSETERQREAVPDLARVPLAAPQARLPRWATACIGLLAAGIVVLAVAWWRSEAARVPAARELASSSSQTREQPSRATTANGEATGRSESAAAPEPAQEPAPLASRSSAPLTAAARTASGTPTAPASGGSSIVAGATAAIEPASTTPPSPARALPNLAQLRASGVSVPALDMQLHSYSDDPTRRFVFINGLRYGEGELTAAGPRVVRIVAEGVVLSQLGQEFLLTVD